MENMHSAQSDHSILLELNKLKVEYNYTRKSNIHFLELNANIMNKGRGQGGFLLKEQSSSTLKSIIPGIQNDRDELKTVDI